LLSLKWRTVDSNKNARNQPTVSQKAPDRTQSSLLISARRIMVAIGVIVGLMQIVQHFQYNDLRIDLFLLAEVVFYVVILPLMGSSLLNLLARSERERSQAARALTQQYALVRSLSSEVGWNDLVEQVVEFPHFVVPVLTTCLYIRSEKTGQYDLAGYWGLGAQPPEDMQVSISAEEAESCIDENCITFHKTGEEPGGAQRYHLLLCLGGKTWGLMRISLPSGVTPSESQAEVLNAISTDLALVLDRAMLRSNVISQAAASEAVRHQIAHDLHDTLAQNIAYLRLKLEELLLEENPSRQISLIRGDLRRMHDTADEAYTQVRDTLVDLQTGESKELLEILQNRARAISERAGFDIKVEEHGQPPDYLDGLIKRQVIYICREALTNIERHSQAVRVQMDLTWMSDCLTVLIQDNGIGFDPQVVDGRHHYGLMIMAERAESIGGELAIQSTEKQGTTITLTVPLLGSDADFPLQKEHMGAFNGGNEGRR